MVSAHNNPGQGIEVSLIGNIVAPKRLGEVRARLAAAGLAGTSLEISQAGSREIDVASFLSVQNL